MPDDATLVTALMWMKASGRPISNEGISDELADVLGRIGIPVVPGAMATLARDIDRRAHAGLPVPPNYIHAVEYAIVAGPFGDHHHPALDQ
jgi:hypothetical protein